ncbi:uncharacterized protein LOC134195765 [Corticium candelabrum]|uniref:uncharacterized protein LOC134195765 n=1 Tax=Corticium candelabrum TaxID=121492 RepID=UPI002E265F80|nr:uncharacterized protein LOC134195765 [Corticium candelabrum]
MAPVVDRPRTFTWQQLAELNQRHNVHVAVRGRVYDLTKFIDKHPGGIDQMLLGAGRDVTQVFEMYHDFSVHKLLDKFYVGDLITNEFPVYPESGEFAKTLKKRVKDRFKELGMSPKDARWTLLRYFWILLGVVVFWYLQTFVYSNCLIGCLIVSIGLAVFNGLGSLNVPHDASHFAVTHKPWVWRLASLWHDFINGMSQTVWNHQHTIGHHPYTNVDHADPDIITAASELPDIRRIKNSQTWLPRYFHQHIYVPLLYGVLAAKTRFQDFTILFMLRKNGNIRLSNLTALQWAVFFGGKLFFVLYRLVIPMLAGASLLQVMFLLMFCDAITSYYLAITFQVSHVSVNAKWPLPDKNGLINADWWEMQVQTTQDYGTESWFTTYMSGALNHQTAHHLFPGVAQCFYPLVTPIVKQTCEEFGIEYHNCGSYWNAVKSHLFHLKQLGREADVPTVTQMDEATSKKVQ